MRNGPSLGQNAGAVIPMRHAEGRGASINVLWLQSVPKISVEPIAELLEDYCLRSFLRIARRSLAYCPAACRAWSVRDLAVRSSSGGGCFSFMGQFCQKNHTQR